MPDIPEITSTKNPRIKHLLELQTKSKTRRKENLFVIEGLLEISRADNAGYRFKSVYFNRSLINANDLKNYIKHQEVQPVALSDEVYHKVAYRQSTGGIIAVAETKSHTLEQMKVSSNPLLLITESVEKPGNIGALLRTADAAGVDGFIICDPLTDLYNPNVIRSSIGAVFTVNVAVADTDSVINWLQSNKISIYGTALTASKRYDKINYSHPSAIIMGTEATGLSDKWLNVSDQNIIIPMLGEMDSLNVSVSAAVVIFEAARQRDFKI